MLVVTSLSPFGFGIVATEIQCNMRVMVGRNPLEAAKRQSAASGSVVFRASAKNVRAD